MEMVALNKVLSLSNLELTIAFVKCFDGEECDSCHGCPLEGESGCAYDLKIEIAKRLMGGN